MLRYKQLLLQSIDERQEDPHSMRDMSRELGIPVTTIYSYAKLTATPRPDNMQKMADYYKESVSSLYSEDSDLTAQLIKHIRQLDQFQQEQLLQKIIHGY